MDEITDSNGKPIVLQDYEAAHIVGVQIGTTGHKLWVCIDGAAVLRIKSPAIELTDLRYANEDVPRESVEWSRKVLVGDQPARVRKQASPERPIG